MFMFHSLRAVQKKQKQHTLGEMQAKTQANERADSHSVTSKARALFDCATRARRDHKELLDIIVTTKLKCFEWAFYETMERRTHPA